MLALVLRYIVHPSQTNIRNILMCCQLMLLNICKSELEVARSAMTVSNALSAKIRAACVSNSN